MYIKRIKLENFRNYDNLDIQFNKDFNLIYGNNAQGKTNILESIYLCAIGKSFQTNKDNELIKIGKENAKIEIEYARKDREGTISIEINDKKTFYINGIKQKKISDILGKINLVLFYPDNINIIKDGPAERRKFLDIMISQLKPNYVHLLNRYLKTLEQRNTYLKQIKFENKSKSMLEIWDDSIAELSFQIYEYRKKYIEEFQKRIGDIHNQITNCGKDKEKIEILFISSGETKKDFLNQLIKNRDVDIKKGYTTTGVHRDDFEIYINDKKVNVYGSQGQQRTAILTLKLAELYIIQDEIEEEPILLLDDFMSELDENRRTNITKAIKNNQVFITCTDKINLDNKNNSIFKINNAILDEER